MAIWLVYRKKPCEAYGERRQVQRDIQGCLGLTAANLVVAPWMGKNIMFKVYKNWAPRKKKNVFFHGGEHGAPIYMALFIHKCMKSSSDGDPYLKGARYTKAAHLSLVVGSTLVESSHWVETS